MATILIIEDEAPLLILAESVVQRAGYETISAATLAEAQAIIHSDQQFDLIFTDLVLGEHTEAGFQLAQMAAQARTGVPVLYTSARALTDGMTALFVENSQFLPKPYTDEQIIKALSKLLRKE
jgi:CheY-like chemotaxis protein